MDLIKQGDACLNAEKQRLKEKAFAVVVAHCMRMNYQICEWEKRHIPHKVICILGYYICEQRCFYR